MHHGNIHEAQQLKGEDRPINKCFSFCGASLNVSAENPSIQEWQLKRFKQFLCLLTMICSIIVQNKFANFNMKLVAILGLKGSLVSTFETFNYRQIAIKVVLKLHKNFFLLPSRLFVATTRKLACNDFCPTLTWFYAARLWALSGRSERDSSDC